MRTDAQLIAEAKTDASAFHVARNVLATSVRKRTLERRACDKPRPHREYRDGS